MDRIRVMIAEDESAVRDALADLISSDIGMELVGSARDTDEAIEVAARALPDVALVDVKMPGGGGARAAREIRGRSPETHVIALSAYHDRSIVLEMLRAGVVGYVVKGTSADEILGTIRRSMQGQGSLSPEVTGDVIHELALLLERSETLAAELRELDRTKSEMIQILSHELFTPITAIQGFAATVAGQGDKLSREEMATLAASVTRASDRIRRLVGNLAASVRLDRKGVEIPTLPVTVERVVLRAASEFQEGGARLDLPDDPAQLRVRMWADFDLAVRALVAVIENALALSPDDCDVQIRTGSSDGYVRVSVLDRGPGVSPPLRDHIFEAFTQGDPSTTRTHQGLGIGLYLAKRIMQSHSGDISVASREGGGSIFTLAFPGSENG